MNVMDALWETLGETNLVRTVEADENNIQWTVCVALDAGTARSIVGEHNVKVYGNRALAEEIECENERRKRAAPTPAEVAKWFTPKTIAEAGQ